MTISQATLKKLFAASGNQCAFPDCDTAMIDSDEDIVIGQIAHIHARNPGGPRFLNDLSEEERDDSTNLMLLCPTHHTIVDQNPEKYKAELLKSWKGEHESAATKPSLPSQNLLDQLEKPGHVIRDRVREYRKKRVEIIQNREELPIEISEGPAVILHLVPHHSVLNGEEIVLNRDDDLRPIKVSGWNPRPVGEGIIGWTPAGTVSETAIGYTLLKHDGCVEAVRVMDVYDRGDKPLIAAAYVGNALYDSIENYLQKLNEKGVEPPIYASISLFDVKGIGIAVGGWRGSTEIHQKFKRELVESDIVELNFDSDIEEELRDAIDRIWREAGHWGAIRVENE